MNTRFRAISYKLYLSAQGLVALIGLLVMAWVLIVSIHDFYITGKAKECIESAFASQNVPNLDSEDLWFSSLKTYGEGQKPWRKYGVVGTITENCSEYMSAYVSQYGDKSISIRIKNYLSQGPPSLGKRAGYATITLGVTVGLMMVLFGLMKWLSWLFKV